MNGIINVYKPSNMSSNYVLSIIKRKCGIKKLGHLGTLDPLATGVLPVMVNKATKLFDYYLNKTKVYRAVFTFSVETDTLDSEGKIIKVSNVTPTKEDIQKILPKFCGKIMQIPPNFSAKKVGGQKAYDLSRKGENVVLEAKEVEIHHFELISQINDNSFLFEIKCSSGTYIRSLARDLAKSLNSCAFMSALIRVQSGEFDILATTYVNDLTKDNIFDKINKLEDLFPKAKRIYLDDDLYKKVTNGLLVEVSQDDSDNLIVFCKNELIGIGKIEKNILKIKTNLQS